MLSQLDVVFSMLGKEFSDCWDHVGKQWETQEDLNDLSQFVWVWVHDVAYCKLEA